MTTFLPGARLGPYEIEAALGAGGMGIVYGARDTRLGRRVAIKLLPADMTGDATAQRRFLQEARTASALDHPNICTIYDVSETPEGLNYLVMAYYDGETLLNRLDRGPIPVDQSVDIVVQILTGLARAHAVGIVHRDIKPANLMLTSDGTVKILDFGVAMLASSNNSTETSEADVVGTVAYMSPEQATGYLPDLRSDLWSVGVVLYEMVAGQRPFVGTNLLALAHSIRSVQWPPLAGEAAALNPLIDRVLQKDKEQRFSTGDEFARALRPLGGDRSSAPGALATGGLPISTGGRRTNIPRNLPSLIGRDDLRSRVNAALSEHALITLAGFGGVGKTRLAQEVGHDSVVGFRGGVWFVDLAGLTDDSEMIPAVARALGVREHASESIDITLTAILRERDVLIILDNCERLTETVANFVEEMTTAAPTVKFLATSRAPLGVYGEKVVRVGGLDESPAISLFEERAAQVQPGIVIDRNVVAELCRRLDYLPLAIELAAARARALTPSEILARVNERLGMLRATDRRAARHQTLEATVGWSYDLLSEPEMNLLNQLSVFVGSFDLLAAEKVCGGSGIAAGDVADVLDRLVDKSLVSANIIRGTMRFRMMDPVREFAEKKLASAGQTDAMVDRHIKHFSSQALSLGNRMHGADTHNASAALLSDIDNLNAALYRLGQQGRHTQKARIVTSLDLFWQIGAPGAGRLRYEELVRDADQIDAEVRVTALMEAASFFATTGFVTKGHALLERARSAAKEQGMELTPYFYYIGATIAEIDGRAEDSLELCDAGFARLDPEGDEFMNATLRARSLTSIAKVRPDEALSYANASLRNAEDLGLDLFTAVSHMLIGTVHMLNGEVEESEPDLLRSIKLAGTVMPQVTIAALVALAAGWRHSDAARSIDRAREALTTEAETEIMPSFRSIAATIIAWHWARDNRPEDAALALSAMDELGQRLGFAGVWWSHAIREEAWAAVRQHVPEDRLGDLAARGRTLAVSDLQKLLRYARPQ